MKRWIRFAAVTLLLSCATPLLADPNPCKICTSVEAGQGTYMWCDDPESDTWAYEDCKLIQLGNIVGCRNGLPMCYYIDVQG
jgi:hypothetical protein